MIKPKEKGDYPDRDVDCQEAIAQGIQDLVDQAVVSGATEAEITKDLTKSRAIGIQQLIQDAVAAGWSEEEAATAIKIVSENMHRGYTGTDPNE